MWVRFIESFNDGRKSRFKKNACFSTMYHHGNAEMGEKLKTEKIVYLANINNCVTTPVLTIAHCQKWIVFLQEILNPNLFSYRIFTFKKSKKSYIYFNLDCENLSRPHALLYLTAFRYPDEYPAYVKSIAESTVKKPDSLWELLQENHREAYDPNPYGPNKKQTAFPAACGGHSLFSSFLIKDKPNITLLEFKSNQIVGQSSVLSYCQTKPEKLIKI